MRLRAFLTIVAFTAPLITTAAAPARAQDASFGCKVLLCAAAVSPSWSGIPYCVPVMTQLFRQLARGGGWPSCAEGGANSGLGYEPYQACPAGMQAYAAPNQTGGGDNGPVASSWAPDANGSYCADPAQMNQGSSATCNTDNCMGSGAPTYTPIPRQARSDPYFVDLTPNGQATQRFYFSLNGY